MQPRWPLHQTNKDPPVDVMCRNLQRSPQIGQDLHQIPGLLLPQVPDQQGKQNSNSNGKGKLDFCQKWKRSSWAADKKGPTGSQGRHSNTKSSCAIQLMIDSCRGRLHQPNSNLKSTRSLKILAMWQLVRKGGRAQGQFPTSDAVVHRSSAPIHGTSRHTS